MALPDLAAYATVADYTSYSGAAPTGPQSTYDRALTTASTLIDELPLATFDVDDAGAPTDSDVAETLAEACCAQVQCWVELGNGSLDQSAFRLAPLGPVSAGGVTVPVPRRYAPAALSALRRVGLLHAGPTVL